MPKWLENEETDGSPHKTIGTWMNLDSIHARVNDPRKDVTSVEEVELLNIMLFLLS